MIFLGILSLVLILLLVIGIHEAGHAIAANVFKVKIQQIAFGFGKPIFKWQLGNNIELILARWPLGGAVRLLNSRITKVSKDELAYCFDKKPIYARFIILISGGLLNFILALIAFIGMYSLGYMNHPAVIQKIIPNSIFDEAGVNSKARIIATLSLAVGLVNLMPLPGLDGGSIFYLLLEKIRKKPLSVAMEILLYQLSLILFCIFFIQIVLNDVRRYFIFT